MPQHAPRGRIKAPADPMRPVDPMRALRCSAHSKQTGNPCKQPAIPGGTVCRYHGGAAPQVIQAAEERLKALVHPAIGRLEHWLNQVEYPSVAIAAVKDVLDRDGKLGKAKETQDLNVKGQIDIVSLLRKRHERHQKP